MSRRHLVLVVGPPLAGADGVMAALRAQLPDLSVVGTDGLGSERAPDAVVAVVSAVAPMVASDWDLIARAAARTDLLIGAVTKIDAHRTWREVLAADGAFVARWDPPRCAVPWVGVAAAPQLGPPDVGDLVTALTDGLAAPTLQRTRTQHRRGPDREPATGESRVVLQRIRLRLLRFVHDRCAALRTELRVAASSMPAGGAARLESRVRDDVEQFLADLEEEIAFAVNTVAGDRALERVVPVAPVLDAPSASRRLENRLMAVLGVGFGLGIALAANRVLAGLAPGLPFAGWAAGGLIGSALVVWVVRTRGVLHDRAVLDRWVTEVAAALRWHGEAVVAERLLTVEAGLRRPRLSDGDVGERQNRA